MIVESDAIQGCLARQIRTLMQYSPAGWSIVRTVKEGLRRVCIIPRRNVRILPRYHNIRDLPRCSVRILHRAVRQDIQTDGGRGGCWCFGVWMGTCLRYASSLNNIDYCYTMWILQTYSVQFVYNNDYCCSMCNIHQLLYNRFLLTFSILTKLQFKHFIQHYKLVFGD